MIIKWTNKYSNETGYVKTVSKAKGYFVNTNEAGEARSFRSVSAAEKTIEELIAMGEGENNNFSVEE